MREGALQDWPLFSIISVTLHFTASSRASAKTRFAPLPPSSRCTRLSVSAAAFEISLPARVEPVKLTMSTSGCEDSCEPTPAPSPFTRLNTPLGKPASCMISAKMIALSGDSSDGFNTIVLPATSAAPTFSVIWFIGQFHGVIIAQTPTASWMMRVDWNFSESGASQGNSFAARMKPLRCATPAPTWDARDRSIGAPISRLIAWARSSARVL